MTSREFRLISLILALAWIFFAPPANAQTPKANELVKINSAKIDPPLRPGGASTLKLSAKVIPGWHINSDKPFSEDYIPTRLEVKGPLSVTAGAIKYPPAQTITLEFAAGDKLSVLGGDIKFEVPLKAGADFAPKPGDALIVTIDYQGCNNTECLRPASVSTTVSLATPTRAAGALEAIGASSSGLAIANDDRSAGTIDRIFSHHGSLLGFLAVFLGCLALNLTPCLYPLIGVTVAYFGNQVGSQRRVMTLAIFFVLGIAITFSSVGVAAALSGGMFGAAMQNRFVLIALAAMLL